MMNERERRIVRRGDRFTSDELERGEVELEQVEPREYVPPEEQGEPWARRNRDDDDG